MKHMKRMTMILMALVLVLAACGSDDAGTAMDYASDELAAPRETPSGGFDTIAEGETDFDLPPDLRIIRQADIQIRVGEGEFDAAWARMRVIAADAGGYLSNASLGIDEIGDGTRYAYGTVTLRVPVDRFDSVLDRLEGVGERLGLSVDSTDVSEEWFDLEARLRHWQSSESFYLRLMDEATTVGELVQVQGELQQVQLEIERIEGRMRYLDDRTSFSTITVGMTEAPDNRQPVDSEPGRFSKIWSDAADALVEALGFVLVAAAAILPFATLAALALLIYWIVRRIRRPDEEISEDDEPQDESDEPQDS